MKKSYFCDYIVHSFVTMESAVDPAVIDWRRKYQVHQYTVGSMTSYQSLAAGAGAH